MKVEVRSIDEPEIILDHETDWDGLHRILDGFEGKTIGLRRFGSGRQYVEGPLVIQNVTNGEGKPMRAYYVQSKCLDGKKGLIPLDQYHGIFLNQLPTRPRVVDSEGEQ